MSARERAHGASTAPERSQRARCGRPLAATASPGGLSPSVGALRRPSDPSQAQRVQHSVCREFYCAAADCAVSHGVPIPGMAEARMGCHHDAESHLFWPRVRDRHHRAPLVPPNTTSNFPRPHREPYTLTHSLVSVGAVCGHQSSFTPGTLVSPKH
jgi:hypothetical protein